MAGGKVVPAGEAKTQEPPRLKPIKKSQDERVSEAKDEAEMILLSARNEAQILKDHAKNEALAIRSKAFAEGKKEGREEGLAEGRAMAEELMEEAQRAVEEAKEERERILAGVEGEVIELVLKIAERLVGNASRLNPEVIRMVMREALGAMPSKGEAKVRVSPQDFEAASKAIKELSSYGKLTLAEDESLSPFECVVETPRGSITSSLDDQLQGLKEDLLMILEGGE